MAEYGAGESPPPSTDAYPDYSQSAEQESPPDPWYRNRLLLAVWATMVAVLIVLIIYGLIQLSQGAAGGPSATTPSTTPTRSSTPTTSTTTPPSTTTTPPPPSSTPEEQGPPVDNGPPPAQSPAPAPEEPEHRHHLHLPHVPPTITLPHTVITLPGF
jgi:cytoskeletal protein RodZ